MPEITTNLHACLTHADFAGVFISKMTCQIRHRLEISTVKNKYIGKKRILPLHSISFRIFLNYTLYK